MSACPLIVITPALQAWAALPVIFRGGRGRLRCHQGRSTLAGRRLLTAVFGSRERPGFVQILRSW